MFSLESLFNTWFTLELVLRFISCDKKLAFVKNWLNIIDLIAILPYYLMLTASKAAIGKTSINEFSRRYYFRSIDEFWFDIENISINQNCSSCQDEILIFHSFIHIMWAILYRLFRIIFHMVNDDKLRFEFLKVIKLFPIITYPCHNSLSFDTNANTACYHSVVFGSW